MKKILLFLFLFFSKELISQNHYFKTSFQAFVEDSAVYACHYSDFYFIAHDCGMEIRYGNIALEKYDFNNEEEWQETTEFVTTVDGYYFCSDVNDVLFIYDPTLRWAYIRTPRGQMQLYYEMPETFKFKIK